MRDRLLYFIVFLAVLLPFTACDKLIYDQPGDNTGSEPKVYLSVNIRTAQAKSGLRSSINENDIFEDYVHSLAMLIFNSDTEGERVGIYVRDNLGSGESTLAFTPVELTAGKSYDFYFVANMPNLQTDLAGISDRNTMDTYLSNASRELNDLLYHGASATGGFPMARAYLNQKITEGGTIYQPKPFKPKQYDTEEGKVVVNDAGSGSVEREYVELIRVVAKLEVTLDGTTGLGVDKVYFRNANRHFRLREFETAPTTYFNNNSTNIKELKRVGTTNTYVYYMPEAIIASADWDDDDLDGNKPINYFTIETINGKKYDIPIISNETPITADYLAKAKGAFSDFTPNYNIYRNHHYKYVVRNLEQIEIIYSVEDWEVVERYTYLGYGYTLEMDNDGNITITNTIDDCMPHHVRLVADNGAFFETDPPVTEQEFGFESEDDVDDPDKLKAGYSEDFKINKEDVDEGEVYLNVYYNGELVKTFTK